jgi:hypothetical protein
MIKLSAHLSAIGSILAGALFLYLIDTYPHAAFNIVMTFIAVSLYFFLYLVFKACFEESS